MSSPAKFQRAEEALIREQVRRDCHAFVFGYVKTKDEHQTQEPIRRVPEEPYLRSLLDALLVSGRLLKPQDAQYALAAGHSPLWLQALASSGLLFVEKSRQVFVTWLVCAYLLWRAKYRAHQLLLVQSKREDDAAALVFTKDPFFARMSFIETHLPKFLQTFTFPKAGAYGHLYSPNGSHVWAIPEGGDILRSQTPSVVFSDEACFQPEFGSAVTAALPACKGGGSFVAVSSANPGVFMDLVEAA